MDDSLTLRLARPDDLRGVDRLLARSYPRLLKADYPPSIMVTLVPLIARARPELLASGRYFVVADAAGRVLGAGGYSLSAPVSAVQRALGHIRHVATDPDVTRQGIGRRLMAAVFSAAQAEGVQRFECLSTRTAVPFYAAVGFRVVRPVAVPLTPALSFPAVQMVREV
jgi:N-acetylglutamate synthase-like GNAT family acetyltransferase